MSTPHGAVAATATFRKATWSETAVLLAFAWCVPFFVHLVPWSGARPLGAYLGPMFWVTFIAAYFFGTRIAIVVGLFSPAINLIVTGLPAWKFLANISGELVLFALLAAWAVRWRPAFLLTAPLACLAAKVIAAPIQDFLTDSGPIGQSLYLSVIGGVAGLVVLAGINVTLVWFYPKAGAAPASRE